MHVTVEAMKLGLADRDTYYADPLFEEVPTGSCSTRPMRSKRRGLLDLDHASLSRRPGDPRSGKALLDPAADPAERRGSDPDSHGARHNHLRGRRPLGQHGGRHAQRLVGSPGRRYRRLAGEPAAKP